MAETAITELIPRDRSEPESPGMRVSVLVERAGSADYETVTGQLNGARPHEMTMTVAPPLDLAKAISLRIKIPELQFDLTVAASACSARTIDPVRGELICAFNPELPGDALVRSGAESRPVVSMQQRKPRPVRARVAWAPEAPPAPVRILSLVGTGLRIASAQTTAPTARLTVHFDTPDGTSMALPALMQWQLRTAERYLIGCTLEKQDDARSARQAIRWLETRRRGRSKPERPESSKRPQRWRDVLTVATCAVVTAAALVLLITRGQLVSPMATAHAAPSAMSPPHGDPVDPLAETLSQLADQVAEHNNWLTDLDHTLQLAQTEEQAAQRHSQHQWQDKQTALADQLARLDGRLNQLTEQLTGIEREQRNVQKRQRLLASQLVTATDQFTAGQQRPTAVTPPPSRPARTTAATTTDPRPPETPAPGAGPRQSAIAPSATPQRSHGAIATASRTWSDAGGTHHVEAVLIDAAGGTARLRTESGRVVDVPIAKLSEADQQFIAAWVKQRPAK